MLRFSSRAKISSLDSEWLVVCWLQSSGSFLLLVVFFPLLLRACRIMVVALLVVSFCSCNLVGGGCGRNCCSDRCDGHCWHSLLLDCKGRNIWHLNVRRADGRSKRTLHCSNCFHCIGFGFLGGIDSDFWLVAVATYYCPDGRFLAFSLIPAV